jgi:DNA-binding transcriptional LysR family regulator
MFGDPLVVRNGRGFAPTPLARRLMPLLSEALDRVERAIQSQLSFEPRLSDRRFTLACTDAHHFHDLPRIAAAFARKLPRAGLRIVSPDFLAYSDGLATGEIDAALVPRPGVPAGQPCEDLYAEGFAFVVRRGHPAAGKLLTAERFNALRHVDTLIVQGRGGIGHRMAGEAFAGLGIARDVALSVPTFGAAALAASRSDLVAGIPASLAEILCRILPLRRLRSPWPFPTFPMALTWDARNDADPGSRCFRSVIIGALKGPGQCEAG